MSDEGRHVTAESLRAEFDAGFGERRPVSPEATPLLAIRVAGAPFAVRLLEAGGLAKAGRIVPVPSRRRELLGVAGFRGAPLPVYSLARLVLGADDPEAPRWLVLAGGEERLALAFGDFEGRLIVRAAELRPVAGGVGPGAFAAAVHPGPPARPVLAVGSIVAAIHGPVSGRSP